jgi:hypothetical protein
MKKEEFTSIEKIKCPYCDRKIDIEAEVKIPQNQVKLMILMDWFNVKAIYTGPDSVKFEKEGPPIPKTWHFFKCVDATDTPMPPKPLYEAKFPDDAGGVSEEIVEPNIRSITETKVISGEWVWKAVKKPTI